QARRLTSVHHTQAELPLGDDAIQLVRDSPEPQPEPQPDSGPDSGPDPIAPTADADWLAAAAEPTAEDLPLIDEPVATVAEDALLRSCVPRRSCRSSGSRSRPSPGPRRWRSPTHPPPPPPMHPPSYPTR